MKRLVAKTGEYEKDGETKGRYTDIGVLMSNDNGEYILLNPEINLAGVLIKQRLLNPKKGNSSVMVSIFSDEPKTQKPSTESDIEDLPF